MPLKIKDNVELSELEKFGFEKSDVKTKIGKIECYTYKVLLGKSTKIQTTLITINPVNKNLVFGNMQAEKIAEVLYKLITANLVESVEE